MADPYLGEIRMFAGKYAPLDWHFCDGSLLSIKEYGALYSLMGTAWGGDGSSTFGLPDLRGRVPLGQGKAVSGTTYTLGQKAGTETVVLTEAEIPLHTHSFNATTADATTNEIGATVTYAKAHDGTLPYTMTTTTPAPTVVQFNAATVQESGGDQPHANVMPVIGVNYIICVLNGLYPQRN